MSDIETRAIEEITQKILDAAKRAQSETDLQTDVEHALRNFFEKLQIEYEPHHNITIIRGRPDTLYGRAVIEYKMPRALRSETKLTSAVEEAQKNIDELSEKHHEDKSKYVGIILDGFQITFTKFRQNKWITEPVSDLSHETTRRMLEYLRGLARKPLHPDFMVEDFGPDSPKSIAKQCVQTFYERLSTTRNPRTRVLFDQWHKTFNQVCGYDFQSTKIDVKELMENYDIHKDKVDLAELLFSTHTYYALLIKFLAAEITVTYTSLFARSFLEELITLQEDKLKQKLENLEEGGIFSELGIKNFLEGDFFSWYLDVWNDKVRDAVNLIIRKLIAYEPATTTLEPDEVRDLLKKLYQYLIPGDIRRALGEFFTPDWLAELTLKEAGFDGNPDKRVLDPACGSGTFLVLTLKKIKEYALDNPLDKSELLHKILSNVVGFDLNPLAVIASRTNYLIALGELLRFRKQEIYIPIYLSDSVATLGSETLSGRMYEVSTSVGKFLVPAGIVKEKLIDDVFSIADDCVRNEYEPNEFTGRLRNKYPELESRPLGLVKQLYEELLRLERKGINRIWTRVIKNAFAPVFVGKFDYVVGNPPWVAWETLPEDYRQSTEKLWENYHLVSKSKGSGMGRIKKDLSMLFTVACTENFLNESGRLAFLITFTLFKNQAGAGFRSYLARKCNILSLHEMVELRPFPEAVNRTSLLVLAHGQTNFPVQCYSWTKSRRENIDTSLPLGNVLHLSHKTPMVIQPIDTKPESPWLMIRSGTLRSARKMMGSSMYKAHEGIVTALNGMFWIEIISKQGDSYLIRNLGDVSWKKKVRIVEGDVEPDLIYPLLRGMDVKRWYAKPSVLTLLPNGQDGNVIDLVTMKTKYSKTYNYFNLFFEELTDRKGEPYTTQMKSWKELPRNRAERIAQPFYYIFNASKSWSKYKVVWKHVSGKISGKGEFNSAVVTTWRIPEFGERVVIPDHGLMIVPCSSEDEAHYLAAILNSSTTREIVGGYSLETHITTDVLKYVHIPQYDSREILHQELAAKSKEAHSAVKEGNNVKLEKIEGEVDKLVEKLYQGLTSQTRGA